MCLWRASGPQAIFRCNSNMADVDVVIIGAGHNGLTCAAYLGMAGLSVRVVERRDVVGGTAVTEEFHPGFRNSVAAYTVSLLQPKVIADLNLHQHGLSIVERRAQNFLPVPDGRHLLTGEGRTQSEIAKFSARDGERYAEFQAALSEAADLLRELVLHAPPNVTWRHVLQSLPEAMKFAPIGARVMGLDSKARRALFDLYWQVGRRLSRPMVRDRRGQGAVRLRFHRRQSRQPLHSRFGLCAAASLVRRGERQEGRLGPRHRRHGRDHAGDGEGGRRAWRAHRHRRRRQGGHRRARPRRGRRARRRHADRRASAVVANVNPKFLFENLVPRGAVPAFVTERMAALEGAAPAPSA